MTRRFTTTDLENLTQSADDGSWEFAADYGEVASRYGRVAKGVDDHNFPLIAAAPELAAELHRIRTELEQLRDDNMRVWGRMIHHETDDYLQGAAREAKRNAQKITRILGDNHE